MGRVFVAPGYGEIQQNRRLDGGSAAGEISLVCDLVVQYLRANQYEAALVPQELTAEQMLIWINRHAQIDDVAVQIEIGRAHV